jgi:hypothetical protein
MSPEPGPTSASALDVPDDCRRLHAGWADSRGAVFATGMDDRLPARMAAGWLAAGGTGPALDAGAGTCTHGHPGPEAPVHLAGVAPGGVFALPVKAAVREGRGFPAAVGVQGLDTAEGPIYGPAAATCDPAHAADLAFIVTFRAPGP